MTIPLARTVRKLKEAISRRLPQRRDDSGLTTLEWLLIVAAVAGLAALAVVLVQNVVSDTSEQIAGSSARKTAAQIAAVEIMADAQRDAADQPDSADTYAEWIIHYTAKCNRLKITYGDAGIVVSAAFVTGATVPTVIAVAAIKTGEVAATLAAGGPSMITAASAEAAAHCSVT